MSILAKNKGFTLIELSIVLIIIGLVIGGILVGRDLISSSAVRAQISQIDKYQQAVNTFRGKYGYLPGDIPDPDATRFGFIARGTYAGEGDGNGLMQSCASWLSVSNVVQDAGETVTLWVDLSAARLIEGSFTTASPIHSSGAGVSGTALSKYLPQGKIGQNTYVYVMSGGPPFARNSLNYFGLMNVQSVDGNGYLSTSSPGLTVKQAYDIDSKIDDGLPQYGNVVALYSNSNSLQSWDNPQYAGGGASAPLNEGSCCESAAVPATAYSCFDNNNTSSTIFKYSITQNSGMGVNCAVSFKFQ